MKVCLAIVLYNCFIDSSDTIKSVLAYLDTHRATNDYTIRVYDNSASEQTISDRRITYMSNGRNLFLSDNYNDALKFCNENEVDFLVLLDQDSNLPDEYLNIIFCGELDNASAAYVPTIVTKERSTIAPYTYKYGVIKSYKIRTNDAIYSINSGTVINVQYFANNVGGFSPDYPIDFLDIWYFKKINDKGGKIEILPTKVCHDLSVAKGVAHISLDRYDSILEGEHRFVMTELNGFDRFVYKLTMIYRYLRFVFGHNKKHASLIKKYLKRRKSKDRGTSRII